MIINNDTNDEWRVTTVLFFMNQEEEQWAPDMKNNIHSKIKWHSIDTTQCIRQTILFPACNNCILSYGHVLACKTHAVNRGYVCVQLKMMRR